MADIAGKPPQTLVDKVWNRHKITDVEGEYLLYTDYLLMHEGARHAFDSLPETGRTIRRPRQVLACADHYVQTKNRAAGFGAIEDAAVRGMLERFERNATSYGLPYYGSDHPQQGIMHVVAPELGLTQPGLLIVGADSHSTTHGAFGCLAFGVGASDALHVLATQALWMRKPKVMKVSVEGKLSPHVAAKDVVLTVIERIGNEGGIGHIIEYAGSAVRAMAMGERMTLCNMAVEAGALSGYVAPDQVTFDYLKGRDYAPKGEDLDKAMAYWKTLASDPGAVYAREVTIKAEDIAPSVTWGTGLHQTLPINGVVPDPAGLADGEARAEAQSAIEYMGLKAGQPLTSIEVDKVFIGSCTNGRIEDLRAAAAVAALGKAKVPAWVVPGSMTVKRQAEAEGLDKVFIEAGFEWREAGCSLCTALNGEHLAEYERCAATSNRNFKGRMGRNGRTHILSPAMAAAAAITGHLTDIRSLAK
ncbi:MAG TPA: 3-isopropylmalate dehydratase large subunit [Stellaceae bacterium]|jgi:3-isopropylmalate/(R)-2-methylmalate dehydratase large subunit|nr:3-isopropylmalate dehydratase large subunit [Stellaceae bacterium]